MSGRQNFTRIATWVAALALAVLTGWVQIMFRDLHLALLAAMAFALTLSLISPRRPWIWGVLIGFAPAAAEFYLIFLGEPILRGEVEAAFGAVLPAFVGAVGGFAMRSMIERVFEKPPETYPGSTNGGTTVDPDHSAIKSRSER